MSTAGSRQLAAVAVAFALWSVASEPQLWTLVVAYVVAVLGLSALGVPRRLAGLPRVLRLLLVMVVLAPGAATAYRLRGEIATGEALAGAWPVLKDRLRLERDPVITPPLLSTDRAQTYFVRADGGKRVQLRLPQPARPVEGEALGHGLFRLDYDPRVHGKPPASEGALMVAIEVDGSRSEREMLVVSPKAHPRWLVGSPDGTRAATVSRETDELILVSARGLVRRIEVADEPVDCAFIDDRQLLVAHATGDRLSRVDARTFAATDGPRVGAWQRRLSRSPDGASIALLRAGPRPELVVLSSPGFAVNARVGLDAAADWLAFGRDATTLVVATRSNARLRRYALGADRQLAPAGELLLGRPAVTLARSRAGDAWLVTTTDFQPEGDAHSGNHFVQDQILRVDSDRLTVDRVWRTAHRTPRQSKPGDVDRGMSPMGMHEAADATLWVAFAGSEELARLGADGTATAQIDTAGSGLYAPHDVLELRDGTLVTSSPSAGALGLLSPGSGTLRPLRLAPDDAHLLRHDSAALARRFGERGFYEGTRSGISCQSCHLHGDTDQGAHNLGGGRLMPTLGVLGLLGTAPFLRDGSYARLAELDHVAQTLYRGYLRRAPGRRYTLAAYLGSLPRPRSLRDAQPRDIDAERRGLDAFVRAQCTRCHAPPSFTHLGQHRVGSLFPELVPEQASDDSLDTPSLLSVGASAPYLNDGRAPSLQAVLTKHNPGNRHGDVARLSETERRDLVVFLESL